MSSIAIRSAVRGRERWQVDPLRSRPRYAAALERELSRHAPIRHVWANHLTGRLLLQYDPGVPRDEVHDRLHSAFGIEPASADELRDWRSSWPRGFNRSPDEVAVEQARLRLILSAGLFTSVLAKRVILGAGMFAGSPAFVTASGIMTIITGYTALRRGFEAVTAIGGVSGRTLLTATTLALLTAAESIDGLGAHMVANWGELFEARAIRDSRAAIHSITHEVITPRTPPPDPYEFVSNAALVASIGAFMITGDAHRSQAMLVGAVPAAVTESRITARALTLREAHARGIYFRDPANLADPVFIDDDPRRRDDANELIRRASLVINQDVWASRLIGIAGFTVAALGKLSAANAAKLHNYTRLAMELNSLRLA